MEKLLSSDRIKAEALRLGFSACGLAPAEAVDETVATAFRQWLADGCQAEMAYMQNYEDKRLDPRLLVEGARTVISVALNYYPAKKLPEGEYQIAWYAYGKDYHDVMKGKLKELFEFIEKEVSFSEETESTSPSVQGRIFCDTAPILERYWAWRTGLGWIGKNTHLIIPHAGSCFFLGEIILIGKLTIMTLHNEINAVRVHVAWMPARQKRWKPLSGSIPRDVFLILPLSIVGNFRSM